MCYDSGILQVQLGANMLLIFVDRYSASWKPLILHFWVNDGLFKITKYPQEFGGAVLGNSNVPWEIPSLLGNLDSIPSILTHSLPNYLPSVQS
jgi:hypothetical protein